MAMVNRPRDFRHSDVVRGIRAVRAAGVEHPSVRIRTPAGTEYFFGGEVTASKKGGTHRIPDPGPKVPVSKHPDEAAFSRGFGPPRAAASLLARGGKTPMAGKADRTITASSDAAVTQQ